MENMLMQEGFVETVTQFVLNATMLQLIASSVQQVTLFLAQSVSQHAHLQKKLTLQVDIVVMKIATHVMANQAISVSHVLLLWLSMEINAFRLALFAFRLVQPALALGKISV
jgi:hypothetical protein